MAGFPAMYEPRAKQRIGSAMEANDYDLVTTYRDRAKIGYESETGHL